MSSGKITRSALCALNTRPVGMLARIMSGWMLEILVLIVLLANMKSLTLASPDAKRLYDDLLRKSGYNKLIRPVGNTTDTLTVKLGLRLTQIIDVVRHLNSYNILL